MNDALRIQISAFIDGELPENESELLLRRLSQDAALRQQVSRYLEIGRLMRQDREVPGIDRLRGRIAAALGDEMEEHEDEQKVVGSALMTPTTGVAVAATVAALALVGLSQLDAPKDPVLQRAVAIDDGPALHTPSPILSARLPNNRARCCCSITRVMAIHRLALVRAVFATALFRWKIAS
jgi:anti-sigma factor RsiW